MRKSVSGFPTRSHTNRAVQPQKMARGLIFPIKIEEGSHYHVAKTKRLISCAVRLVTAQRICVFVFAYVKSRFSHDAAQMV